MLDSGNAGRLRERLNSLGLDVTQALTTPRARLPACGFIATECGSSPHPRAAVPGSDPDTAVRTADLPRLSIEFEADQEGGVTAKADFSIVRLLGEGGMGRVYLATQRSLGREVAIKTIKASATPVHVEGLLREARISGALEHPGIIPVHTLGRDADDQPILVMKRVEGVSLRGLLDDPTHPGWQTLLASHGTKLEASIEVLIRVCQSLAFGHSRGIIHRDIKPDNIMLGAYGEVYLLDWGLAINMEEAATPGALVGTPVCMAPEMVFGEPPDIRTDVYLLGATLHEILTGTFRHDGGTVNEVLLAAATSEPIVYSAEYPTELAALCNRATARDRAARPVDVEAFRRELSAYLRRRGALALCEVALERTVALEAMLRAVPDKVVPVNLAGAYRLATEARFAFTQLLRDEPLLEPAREGLERSLLALIDLELRQGHAETASALLAELGPHPAIWDTRVQAVREAAERMRRDAEQLRIIERDENPSISAGPRTMGLVGLVITLVWLAISTLLAPGSADSLTPTFLLQFAVALSITIIALVFVFRQNLLRTQVNRRITAVVFVTLFFTVFHRVLAVRYDDSVLTILRDDLSLLAALFMLASFVIDRGLWTPTALLIFTRLAFEVAPEFAGTLFGAATIGAVLLVIILLRRRVAEAQRAAEAL